MFSIHTTFPLPRDGNYIMLSPAWKNVGSDLDPDRDSCTSGSFVPNRTSPRCTESDTMDALDALGRYWLHAPARWSLPQIRRVIVNGPATIVYWGDGEKTVVKCQPCDTFNAETGLMAAMLKRFMGNDNTYNKVLNHWMDKPEVQGCHAEDADATSE